MKITPRQTPNAKQIMGRLGKRITNAALTILLAATTTTALADVASRVVESNSTAHKGVLAFVRDSGPLSRRTEQHFFGQGLRKVSVVAPDFQIQIVEPEDIPGGAPAGSFVALTPAGDRVVTMQRGCKSEADLRSLVNAARDALASAAPTVVAYFEYDD